MDTCRRGNGPHSDRQQMEYQCANVAEAVVEAIISIQFSVLRFGSSRDDDELRMQEVQQPPAEDPAAGCCIRRPRLVRPSCLHFVAGPLARSRP